MSFVYISCVLHIINDEVLLLEEETENLLNTLPVSHIYEAFSHMMVRGQKKNINLRISNELLDKVNNIALRAKIPRNSIIIIMICMAVDGHN